VKPEAAGFPGIRAKARQDVVKGFTGHIKPSVIFSLDTDQVSQDKEKNGHFILDWLAQGMLT
jgi:hypothetical protein